MTPQKIRRPVRRRLSAVPEDRKFTGCVLPLVVALLVMGGVAYVAYRQFGIQGILDKLYPNHPEVEIIDPSKFMTNIPPAKVEKPEVKGERDDGDLEEAPEPKRKTVAELRAEADAAEKQLDADVAKARAAGGKTLPAFAGVKFGETMEGPATALGALPLAGPGEENALCYQMSGPPLSAAFRQFGARPRVFVTPVTKRAFRIELSCAIARRPGWPLNPETTNLVEKLAGKLKSRPFSLDVEKVPLGRREFIFPFGETTLVVGEYGGEQLKLTVEHAGFRAAAVKESASFREQSAAEAVPSKTLVSDKYPNGGTVKFGRVKMKKGTPKAFGGIVFGSLPPYSAKVSAPASRQDARYFFIDYRKAKMEPFLNFDHGRAELSSVNGAVTAVRLYSNGPDNGLSDAAYYRRVREAVEKRFKTQPTAEPADPLAPIVYEVGSLKITLAPDANGGFSLGAENVALKEAW